MGKYWNLLRDIVIWNQAGFPRYLISYILKSPLFSRAFLLDKMIDTPFLHHFFRVTGGRILMRKGGALPSGGHGEENGKISIVPLL